MWSTGSGHVYTIMVPSTSLISNLQIQKYDLKVYKASFFFENEMNGKACKIYISTVQYIVLKTGLFHFLHHKILC